MNLIWVFDANLRIFTKINYNYEIKNYTILRRAREVIEVEVIDAEVIEAVVIEGGSYRGRRLLREEVIEGGGYRGRKLLREEFIEVEFIEGGSY